MTQTAEHAHSPEARVHERVLIVDYGSQVTQLIARRVREDGVYCEVHPCQKVDDGFLDEFRPQAVILSGGPESVTSDASPRAPAKVFELGVPVLGICYGEMTMSAVLGGAVASGQDREFGRAEIQVERESPLLAHAEPPDRTVEVPPRDQSERPQRPGLRPGRAEGLLVELTAVYGLARGR